MAHRIIITIDGFSSCGKSTLAKDVAKKLNYRYIDTGAMYRAVTLYFITHNINHQNTEDVLATLENIHLDIEYDKATGKQIMMLNGTSVEEKIRGKEVSDLVSPVSTIREVRHFCVSQQQNMGKKKGIVMDGRDIGTVVFPQAELKIFLTAEEYIRVERRYAEIKATGQVVTRDEVRKNLLERDYIDTNRKESPLRKAEDAIVLDNTHITQEEQADRVMGYVIEKLHARAVK